MNDPEYAPLRAELVVRQPVLSSGGTRYITEGGVTFHRPPYLVHLTLDDLPVVASRRPDLWTARILGLTIPFDFDAVASSIRYVQATVSMSFEHPAVSVQTPELVLTESLVVPDGSARDRPRVTVFGLGGRTVRWRAESTGTVAISDGSQTLGCVLSAPASLAVLSGALEATAVMARGRREVEASLRAPVRFELGVEDGAARFCG